MAPSQIQIITKKTSHDQIQLQVSKPYALVKLQLLSPSKLLSTNLEETIPEMHQKHIKNTLNVFTIKKL